MFGGGPLQNHYARWYLGGLVQLSEYSFDRLRDDGEFILYRAHPNQSDDGLLDFACVRPRLFGIAYSMLGNRAEAEDIVQDVWLRWHSTNRRVVQNPPAFLVTTATRLCINLIQSAHTRYETCIGTWLSEPVDTSSDPELAAERGEALELAAQLLLEKLSPAERAAYVLREAFDYPYRQIAVILQMDEANLRQMVSRARRRIADGRRMSVSSDAQRRFLEAFMGAAQTGDMSELERVLAEDVVCCSGRHRNLCAHAFHWLAVAA